MGKTYEIHKHKQNKQYLTYEDGKTKKTASMFKIQIQFKYAIEKKGEKNGIKYFQNIYLN